MVQAGDGLRLALEALLEIGVRGDMLGQYVDGDGAVQAGVRAFETSPIPPAPMSERILYGPSVVPGCEGMTRI